MLKEAHLEIEAMIALEIVSSVMGTPAMAQHWIFSFPYWQGHGLFLDADIVLLFRVHDHPLLSLFDHFIPLRLLTYCISKSKRLAPLVLLLWPRALGQAAKIVEDDAT